jgi:hypothetical protein
MEIIIGIIGMEEEHDLKNFRTINVSWLSTLG